jgi:hypothetical protein
MSESLQRGGPAAALARNPAGDEPLGLQTGYFDDVRQTLTAGHDHYRLFRWAHDHQDQLSDAEHLQFWSMRLHLWPRKRGAHQTHDSISFALAVGMSDGFTFDEIVAELPYRSREALRDRHLHAAERWREALDSGRQPDPGVARLPRIYTDAEEGLLPQPPSQNWTFGLINLPRDMPSSSIMVGNQAIEALDEICGALAALRERRGWPSLTGQVRALRPVTLDDRPVVRAAGPPPGSEMGHD